MRLNITIEIWRKGKWFLAKSHELEFLSQGRTIEEAKKNLLEVIKIKFYEMKKMEALNGYLSHGCPNWNSNLKMSKKGEIPLLAFFAERPI